MADDPKADALDEVRELLAADLRVLLALLEEKRDPGLQDYVMAQLPITLAAYQAAKAATAWPTGERHAV